MTRIGNGAFSGCKKLTNVAMQNGITSIGEQAFFDCKSLEELNIPESVDDIGRRACSGVQHITYTGSATGAPWGANSMN